ncbi:MAG: GAF domain-containing protein [Actinobacteria bacterium]|nr:GAF domain-containing protein [Actinomycetota bacterium]
MDAIRELKFLQRLAQAAAATLDSRELVRLVISETTEALATDVCSIYLVSEDGRDLILSATNGLSQASVGRVRLRIGEGVTGWAAEALEPVVVPDVRADSRFRWLPGVDQARFVSMCSVPIVAADRLVGVLNVQTDMDRTFSGADVEFLAAIAAQVAGVLERSSLQSRLEGRLTDLKRSAEIHGRFTELALVGAGLDAICDAITGHAGAPLALYDEDGERLAPQGSDSLPVRLAGFADPARRTDELTVNPVRAGRDILGWLAVSPGDGVSPAIRQRAIEHGVTVLALELSRERAAAEVEMRLRGDLVTALLTDRLRPADANRLAIQAARLGYRIRGKLWVLVVEPDDPAAERALAEKASARRVLRAVSATATERAPGSLVIEHDGSILVLVPGEPSAEDVEGVAWAILAAAGHRTGGASFSCGIGGAPGRAVDLHDLSRQSRAALKVGQRLGRNGEVMAYRRLGVERLLLDVGSHERLEEYVDEWLGPLLRHESEGKAAAPLVETIEALAATGWNLRSAARRLNVHVNTLLYRLDRARALSGRDLDDPDVRLAITLALRAHSMVRLSDDVYEKVGETSRGQHPYPRPMARA